MFVGGVLSIYLCYTLLCDILLCVLYVNKIFFSVFVRGWHGLCLYMYIKRYWAGFLIAVFCSSFPVKRMFY